MFDLLEVTSHMYPISDIDIYLVSPSEPASDLITVIFDENGCVSINGNVLSILNSKTSRHGKLLEYFESNKDRLIETSELAKLFPGGKHEQQPLKDLKTNLRLLGYRLNYFKPRGGAYTYYGLHVF
jgi:hypothetical protein